jgi:hypothetical protein
MAADLAVVGLNSPQRVERAGERAGRAVRAAAAALAVVAVLLGLALRIWTIGRAPINSDEAVVGLMAHEILHGHFFAFYWGQQYGGVEPYVTAALFAVFGQSAVTLSMTSILLDAVAAVLVWRVGRRLFRPVVGVGAPVLFWVWPEVYVHQSTIEYGFRWAALVLGLSMLLVALRLCDDLPVARPRGIVLLDWVLLGAAVGLGWWATPEIAYYLAPTALLLAFFVLRRGLRPGWLGLGGMLLAGVLGALPWLWVNVGHGFPSLHSAPQGKANAGLVHHLHIFFRFVLPMVLGLRLRGTGAWLFDPLLAKAVYLVLVVLGAALLVMCALRRRAVVLVVFAVLAPAIYAYWPATWYWSDGRYAVFLAPVASLLATAAAGRAVSALRLRAAPVRVRLPLQRLGGAVLVVAAGLALTLGAAGRLAPYVPSSTPATAGWFSWRSNPNAYLLPTVSALEHAGVRDVYAGYWAAYDLAFEADGGLTVSDVTSFARYLPYLAEIESSERTAWLFPSAAGGPALGANGLPVPSLAPGCIGGSGCLTQQELQSYLTATHDPYRRIVAGDFVAVLPRYPAVAGAVLASAGIKGAIG